MTAVDDQREFAAQTLDCWLTRLAEAGIPEFLLLDVFRERAETVDKAGFLGRVPKNSIAPDGCGRNPADSTMHSQMIPIEEIPNRVLKRAQYEAFEFELLDSRVRVRNESYADPENHEYEVTIEEGVPTACTCPADARFDNPCKHRVAVAIRRPILEFVEEVQVVADGGAHPEVENEDDEGSGPTCACSELSELPCWECYRNSE